jgi:formylglycine-generating enzyme required for sulfatase activity
MAERRFGILIGSSYFPEEPKLETLRFPENDVEALRAVLSDPDRGAFHELELFKNRPRAEILHKLNRIFNDAGKNDLILIYYSGHGKLNSLGRLHLTTVDTHLGALEATAISMGAIRELVDISATHKVVLLLDCCFSGAVGGEFLRSSVDDQLLLTSKARGTYIMTASTAIQVAKEKEADQLGLFTKHLVQGIRSGDADLDHNGQISMDELYRYVHERVLAESAQQPMRWDLNVRGELNIARSGKTARSVRNQQLRILLADLYKEERLPDDIFDKARKLIGLPQDQISGALIAYDQLLDRLLDESVRPLEFIKVWYQLDSKATGTVAAPAKKPEPPAKPSPQPVPVAEAAATTPLAEQTVPSPKLPRPKTPLIAASIGLALLAVIVIAYIMINPHQPERTDPGINWETRFEAIFGMLKQNHHLAAGVTTLKAVSLIQAERERVIQGWEKTVREAQADHFDVTAFRRRMAELDNQWQEIMATKQRELAEQPNEPTQPAPTPGARTVKLFVATAPKDADIKIMNIKPPFEQDMALEPGRYHLWVGAKGYLEKDLWVELDAGPEKRIEIALDPIRAELLKQITNSLGMTFVYIPAGSFTMGSPKDEPGHYTDEQQHPVTLTQGFYLQTTEVTQGQWRSLMDDNPSHFKDCGDRCPVEKVSWEDAQRFINKLNQKENDSRYCLPTEAQWEYAARAGSGSAFANGEITELECGLDPKLNAIGWYCGNSRKTTHPVAQKESNAWGLFDMHGNVWEWCADWYGTSPKGGDDPTGPSSGSARVVRGGSWGLSGRYCRSAFRNRFEPGYRSVFLGFRLVLLPGQ